jgi:hypothetical protein
MKVRILADIEVDSTWAKNVGVEGVPDYFMERLNSSLGFRGKILKCRTKVLDATVGKAGASKPMYHGPQG